MDSRKEGNQVIEAYRQDHPWDGSEPPGHSASERTGDLENAEPWRPSPQPWGEGSMSRLKLAETAVHSGVVVAIAWWQGHAEQLEKPSSPRGEIPGER